MLAINFVEKGRPDAYRADYARYARVTAADLQRVARTYLAQPHFTLNIRPTPPGQARTEPAPAGPLANQIDPTPLVARTIAAGPDWTVLPGAGTSPGWFPPAFTRARLGNGIQLWNVAWRTLPIVEVRLMIPVGSGDDPAGKSGLARLTATLFDNGTRTKTNAELTEAFDALGASLGTTTTADATLVNLTVLARNLKPALTLMGEVLREPRFDAKDFDLERGLQADDIRRGPDSPRWIAARALRALLYGQDHPYGNPPEGFEETLKGITLDDVRGFAGRYAANQSRLIVVGAVESEPLKAILEEALGGWATTGPVVGPRPNPPTGSEPGIIYLADKPGAVQSTIQVARHWVGRKDPRYFATLVGNHIVGDDFLSRLNANLREKNGFTYGAAANFGYRRTGSVWQVSTSVRADVTVEALREITRELDALAKEQPLTVEEIGTAPRRRGPVVPRGVRRSSEHRRDDGHPGRVRPPRQLPRLVPPQPDRRHRRAGPRGHRRSRAAPPARRILIVGDRATLEPKLRDARLGEVRVIDPNGRPLPPR